MGALHDYFIFKAMHHPNMTQNNVSYNLLAATMPNLCRAMFKDVVGIPDVIFRRPCFHLHHYATLEVQPIYHVLVETCSVGAL